MVNKLRYEIEIENTDVTSSVIGKLKKADIVDTLGIKSDTLTLEFNDPDGKIAIPEYGVKCRFKAGYGGKLYDFNEYVVDGVRYGKNRNMIVAAKGFDSFSKIKTIRERSFEDAVNFGNIVDIIAREYGYMVHIPEDIRNKTFKNNPVQINKSDMAFLSKISKTLDCRLKISGNNLIIAKKGRGKKIDGSELNKIIIRESDLSDWGGGYSGKGRYKSFKASYFNVDTGEEEEYIEGNGVPEYSFSNAFGSPEEAKEAIRSKRREKTYKENSLWIALKNKLIVPKIRAETKIEIIPFKDKMHEKWVVGTAKHTIKEDGEWSVRADLNPITD